jgi:hypothetical protein
MHAIPSGRAAPPRPVAARLPVGGPILGLRVLGSPVLVAACLSAVEALATRPALSARVWRGRDRSRLLRLPVGVPVLGLPVLGSSVLGLADILRPESSCPQLITLSLINTRVFGGRDVEAPGCRWW